MIGTAVFVFGVGWWGLSLLDGGTELHVGVAPLYARWRVGWETLWAPALLVAVGIALVVPGWWVRAVKGLRWGWVLLGSWLLALVWSVALAATDGTEAVAEPLLDERFEYLPLARSLDGLGDFVSGFVERIDTFPTHVRGHPPGAVLAFWGLDGLFPTDRAVTIALLAITASVAPASLIAVRALTDSATARRAAPFVGLAPAALWIATSSDALFAAVVAWAVTLVALAVAATRTSSSVVAAAGAGVLSGLALCLTYGAPALLGPLAVLWVVLLVHRRIVAGGALVLGVILFPALLALMGFDWLDGFAAVREQYVAGVGSERPYWYFVVANLAAFAIAVGPAAVAGVATLRIPRIWWLVGGALGGVLLADITGLSKGEVERIWLPAVGWVVIATCSIRSVRTRAAWAATTMALTIVMQWRLRIPW